MRCLFYCFVLMRITPALLTRFVCFAFKSSRRTAVELGNFNRCKPRTVGKVIQFRNSSNCYKSKLRLSGKLIQRRSRGHRGFKGIYDVEHFIKSLRFDVKIVESLPEIRSNGKTKKMKAFQVKAERDAPISWYRTTALELMKKHGAIYITPFSHLNYHALQFKPHIMKLSNQIVNKLRSQGHFMAIHLRFEMDMLAFAGYTLIQDYSLLCIVDIIDLCGMIYYRCYDIFTPQQQKILKKYRKENFAVKELVYDQRRAIGKCPLTPEEVGLILRAMDFDNSTRIYIAAGELFGGERFMKPFRTLFPHLENHSTVGPADELAENTQGLLGSAVDYMVCLLADIFMPTYDGPSNFANNVMGHRLYYGFRTVIHPDRKALAPIFIERENGKKSGFNEAVKRVMSNTPFGGPHKRISPESFYTNSWPECFCQIETQNEGDRCPPDNVLEVLDSKLQNEESNSSNQTDST
ncbi:GDP-fucose protein O-fucosyltransferase 1 [Ranunculus cassubicifolius]